MVVEDAAQGLGGSLGDRTVGGAGTACFSFYTTTNLPVGEGGMVTTDDPARAERLRAARMRTSLPRPRRAGHNGVIPGSGHPRRRSGRHADRPSGRNRSGQLAHLVHWQHRREQFAALYDAQLAGIVGYRAATPAGNRGRPARLAPLPAAGRASVRAPRRGDQALTAARIRTDDRLTPLHQLPYARDLCDPCCGLPGAERVRDSAPGASDLSAVARWCRHPVAEALAITLR